MSEEHKHHHSQSHDEPARHDEHQHHTEVEPRDTEQGIHHEGHHEMQHGEHGEAHHEADAGTQAEHAMHEHPGREAKQSMLMDETGTHEHGVREHAMHEQASTVPATGMAAHAAHAGHMDSHAAHDAHGAHGAHAGHIDHTGHEDLFRRKFWVSLLLSIPVLLYSEGLQMLIGFSVPAFPGSTWVAPLFSLAVFLYGGVPFIQMALPELREGKPGMMTLISLAISVAFVYSVAALFLPNAMDFFWELVTLIDIMLLGHWIEMRSVRQASGALDALAKLMPDTAELVRPDGSVETVNAAQLRAGDVLLVRPGSSVPADGEIIEGESALNEAMITGESRPVNKGVGERVIGGSINGDRSLRVRVTATGEDTALAGIMRLVNEAQQSRSRTQVLADRAAGWLFYIALGAAALTAIAWTLAVGFNVEVIERVATVLVIACPHALGLAIPLVVAITTAMGARNGILVRDRLALERAREIDTVIFDKTGTLTKGEFGVVGIETVNGEHNHHWNEDRALALAAALEGDSEHTIAQGIRRSADERKLERPQVSDFEAVKGRGITARVNGSTYAVGGPRMLEMLNAQSPERLARFEQQASARGQSVVYLIEGAQPVAAFALADVVRPESREAVRALQEMGVEVAMLTGDSQAVAQAVAEDLGITTYFAEVLPEHKDEKIRELQRQGKRVAMVGDGVNDAPALTRADVGIAIGSGTDVAVESAGIILVKNNPLDVVKIFRLSRSSYRKMIQNLIWAAGYNVVAIPLAAGVLAPVGILLSPAAGAVLMSLSTIIVAINAQLLRRESLSA